MCVCLRDEAKEPRPLQMHQCHHGDKPASPPPAKVRNWSPELAGATCPGVTQLQGWEEQVSPTPLPAVWQWGIRQVLPPFQAPVLLLGTRHGLDPHAWGQ